MADAVLAWAWYLMIWVGIPLALLVIIFVMIFVLTGVVSIAYTRGPVSAGWHPALAERGARAAELVFQVVGGPATTYSRAPDALPAVPERQRRATAGWRARPREGPP